MLHTPELEHLYYKGPVQATGSYSSVISKPYLLERYRVMTAFQEPYYLFEQPSESSAYLRLPRGLVTQPAVYDTRTEGLPLWHHQAPHFDLELRDNQFPLVKPATHLLDQGHNFILRAGTGFGKTIMGLFLAAYLGRHTLIVVTKEDLMKRWRDEIQRCFGIPKSEIGILQGDKIASKPFTVGMIHTLAKAREKYPDSLRARFGTVIFDECHRLAADLFNHTAYSFPARHRIGLTATPKRQDGKELLLYAHVGPVAIVGEQTPMEPKIIRYTSAWHCPRDSNGHKIPHSPGKSGHVLKALCGSQARNNMIADLASTAVLKLSRKVVVMSDIVNHLKNLRALCSAMGVPGSKMGFYTGAQSEAQKTESASKPLIFATYPMMGEGTDIPWLDFLIMATPRSKIEQPLGRILREYDDKPEPICVDIVDLDSGVYRNYAKSRLKFYHHKGYKVIQG